MRLTVRSQISSSAILFLTLLLATNITAQGLPKLSSEDATAGKDTPATSGGADSATGSAATPATQATNKPSATKDDKPSGTTDAAASSFPALSSDAAAYTSDAGFLTGLPKLAGANYPPPTVPPTADAPFMQKSTLPEGTVFIGVGAGLGFIGFLVLAWRGLVAWSIHRSVRRAAFAQTNKYGKSQDPRSTFANTKSAYFSPAAGSTLSLDHLAVSGKGGASKQQSAHNSLFFSPTAATGGVHSHNNRTSAYLPAGYYASGNPAPSGMTHLGSGAVPMSNMTNQNRYSHRNSRGPSPPRSPSLPPSRGADSPRPGRLSTSNLINHASSSSLNLSAPPQGRAPSAYLEDLFENHPPGSSGQLAPEDSGRSRR